MKKIRLLLTVFLAWAFGSSHASVPDEHRSLSIYQIMVASFQHDPSGAKGYSAMWGPDGHRKNGNIKGITASLDYIKALGVNAIWLTPVFDSSTAFGGEKLQATGYFTNDYFKIDPHFGTDNDFRELVEQAHERGLYVILDGVFGHHGGVVTASPSGYKIDTTPSPNDREPEGKSNVAYPGSLDYFKEVATYWIDKYDIDGWRLDQAYQAMQGGHNYWKEIRGAVEDLCRQRKADGKQWGTLGYMVGEDWGDAKVINRGVYRNGGLKSAFDFQGKELISGAMQDTDSEGLEGGWDDVIFMFLSPKTRGYANNSVIPNLFLTNHDGYRLADHFKPDDPHFYEKQMTRFAILAAYNGPITLYYGDEYADITSNTKGGQKDNIARTSGHLDARNAKEEALRDYLASALNIRRQHSAMWRGVPSFERLTIDSADVLIVDKFDKQSNDRVIIIFSDKDASVPVKSLNSTITVKAWRPEIIPAN